MVGFLSFIGGLILVIHMEIMGHMARQKVTGDIVALTIFSTFFVVLLFYLAGKHIRSALRMKSLSIMYRL